MLPSFVCTLDLVLASDLCSPVNTGDGFSSWLVSFPAGRTDILFICCGPRLQRGVFIGLHERMDFRLFVLVPFYPDCPEFDSRSAVKFQPPRLLTMARSLM